MSTDDKQDRTVEQEGTPTGVPIMLTGTPDGVVKSRARALPPEEDPMDDRTIHLPDRLPR